MKTEVEVIENTIDRQTFFKMVGVSVGAIVLQHCLSGCGKNNDPVPKTDVTVNINSGTFTPLRNPGGFVYTDGIIIARTLQGAFIAVSQACTHEGTRVNFNSTNSTFVCPSHGSIFTERGEVQRGPATRPLTVFRTSFDSSTGDLRVFPG
ncbi:MAG: ubiquinol-cytochrome c reductase iron-sulfur subunit [Runella sp.]